MPQQQLHLGYIKRRRKPRDLRAAAPIVRPIRPGIVPQVALQFPTGHPVVEYQLKPAPQKNENENPD